MNKKLVGIIVIILVLTFGVVIYFLHFNQSNLILKKEINGVNLEQMAGKFISENDPAYIEDGYDLELVSKENSNDKNIKMTFFYKMHSYPEGDEFRADVIVNTLDNSVHFVEE